MRRFLYFRSNSQLAEWSPRLIAVGLILLIATIWWPAMPATIGMALVALGATGATISRFQACPGFDLLLLLHLMVYGGLCALCVGARLDAWVQGAPAMRIAVFADLAASICPAAAALTLAGNALISQPSAD